MGKRAHNGGKAADHEGPQKRPRVDLSSSEIIFIEPFEKEFKLDDPDDEWVVSWGLKKLLDVMTDAKNLVGNASLKEFVQEFRALNGDPPLRYETTIQSGTCSRVINIDAELLASKFDLPHNYPFTTELGGGREAKWNEGYKFFKDVESTYDKKKGWRLENLSLEEMKTRYKLLHRLIWFAKRHDFVANGQARAIHGVCEPKDSQQQLDWATTVLRNLAREILKLQKNSVKESKSREDKETVIGPIIRHILDTLDDKENNEQALDKGGATGAATHLGRGQSESNRNGVTASRDNETGGDDRCRAPTHLDSRQSELDKAGVTGSRDNELASDKGHDGGGAATHTDSEQGEVEVNGVIVSRDNDQTSDKGGDLGDKTCRDCNVRRSHISSLSSYVEMSLQLPECRIPDNLTLRIITGQLSYLRDFLEYGGDLNDECDRSSNSDDSVKVCKIVLEFLDQCVLSDDLESRIGISKDIAKAYWNLACNPDLVRHMSQRGCTVGNICDLLEKAQLEEDAKATSYCLQSLGELSPYVNPSEFPDLLAAVVPLLETDGEDFPHHGSTGNVVMRFLAEIIMRDDDFFQQMPNGSRYPELITSFWDSFDSLFQNSRRVKRYSDVYLSEDVHAVLIKRLAVLQQQSKDLLLFQEMILTTSLILPPEHVTEITSSLHRSKYLSFAQATARLQQTEYGLAMEVLETIARGDVRAELTTVDQHPHSEQEFNEEHVLPPGRIILQQAPANVLLPPVKLQAYRSLTFLKTISGDLDGALNTIGLEEPLRLQMEKSLQMEKAAACRHGDSRMSGISVGHYLDYDAVLETSVISGLQFRLNESLAALRGHTESDENLHFSYAHKAYIYFLMGEKHEALRYIQEAVEKRLALKKAGLLGDMNWLHPKLSYLPTNYKALFHLTNMSLARGGYPQSPSYVLGSAAAAEHVPKLFEKLAPCLSRISNYCNLSRAIQKGDRAPPDLSTDLSRLCYVHLWKSRENISLRHCLRVLETIKACEDPRHLCSFLADFDSTSDEQLLEKLLEDIKRYKILTGLVIV